MGVEGGGTTIFGTQAEGVWSFWTQGTSMNLDENDDEVWRSWSSEPESSLDLVVPHDWPVFYPSKIHPDLRGLEARFPRINVDTRINIGMDTGCRFLAVQRNLLSPTSVSYQPLRSLPSPIARSREFA
jgi:hypothetical protein